MPLRTPSQHLYEHFHVNEKRGSRASHRNVAGCPERFFEKGVQKGVRKVFVNTFTCFLYSTYGWIRLYISPFIYL